MTGRERLFAHLDGLPVDHFPALPITMAFAARLIGAPYRAYATDHRVLAQGQMAVAETFGTDHVSVISDPAREAADLGAEIEMPEDGPPGFDEAKALLARKARLGELRLADPAGGGRMTDRLRGVELLRRETGATRVIEGWVEGPCAEGADLRGINALMLDFVDDPEFVHELFCFCAEQGLAFAKAQIDAGADVIGIGDAAASLVGPAIYDEFVHPYEHQLVRGIRAHGGRVRLHICGNTSAIVGGMARLGCDLVDLDYPVEMAPARRAAGPAQALLGNLDPVRILRAGPPRAIEEALAACERAAGSRWVVGAGCEVPRDTPPAHLHALMAYARAHVPVA